MERITEHPDYQLWRGMRRRCRDEKYKDYYKYGARGIDVCDRWMSFRDFIADMGPRPSSEYSIDRIDGTKGYSPENCRWATANEQNANRRDVIPVEVNGVEYPSVRSACVALGLTYETVSVRLRRGEPVHDAFNRPPSQRAYRNIVRDRA